MNRFLSLLMLLVLALALWACSQNDEPIPVDEKNIQPRSQNRLYGLPKKL